MKYLLMACLLIATNVCAETYKWEDKDGGIHFTENLASVPKKYRAKAMAEASGDITTRDSDIRKSVDYSNARAKKIQKEDEQKAAQSKTNTPPEKKKEFKGAMHQYNEAWLKSR